MNLQNYLDSRKMTKYNLSKISGVPKTTVIDICSGKESGRIITAYFPNTEIFEDDLKTRKER